MTALATRVAPAKDVVRVHWWMWPVAVFAVTRIIDALMIQIAQRHQIAISGSLGGYHITAPSPASPGYFGVAANWDGQWYWQIALNGYPSGLPTDAAGDIQQNEWAFAPLYPLIVGALTRITGLSFPIVSVFVTTACALVGVVFVSLLVEEQAGTFAARATSLLLCTQMAAASFQIAYTEGPALMFLASALWCIRRERYLAAGLLLWGLGLTRHVLLPVLGVLVVLGVQQWRNGRLTGGTFVRVAALFVSTVVAVGAWPAVAALRTGSLGALTDTQSAWRTSDTTGPLGLFSIAYQLWGVPGLLFPTALVCVVGYLVLRPAARAWSPEIRAWSLIYPAYVLVIAPAATSYFRFLLLAFPLAWPFPDQRIGTRFRWALVLALATAGLVMQWYWVRNFLVLGPIAQQSGLP